MRHGNGLNRIAEPGPLLAPVEALLRGFDFDEASAAQQAQASAPSARQSGEVLLREGFRIGDLRLMIRYEDGSELTDIPQIYLLPRAPAWFRGMANLHGTLVPVFDPAGLFGVAHDEGAKPMLLVLGHGEEKAGLVIDGLPVRLRVSAADRIENAAMPGLLADCATHAYWADEADWVDLQVSELLDRLSDELAGGRDGGAGE